MSDAADRTTVDPTVIAGIAAIAATQVPGVRLPVGTAVVPGLLAADPEPPVRSWCADDGSIGVALTVEVEVPAPGGRSVLDTATAVRREVVGALAAMTRLDVSCCDVHVADLVEPATADPVLAPVPTGAVLPGTAPPSFDDLARAADAEAGALLPPAGAVPRPRSGEEPLPLG